MNILVTLPKHLLEKIISGEKTLEMRKCRPKLMGMGVDGFFIVEKGTDNVRCWCRVDDVYDVTINHNVAMRYSSRLCVSTAYIEKYANDKKVYMWKIGKVIALDHLKRETLGADRNPQQFTYCLFSYGESY